MNQFLEQLYTSDFFNALVFFTFCFFTILLYIWITYNDLIRSLNQIKNDFSDIIVELKRRASLIDQLSHIVNEYSKHEKATFVDVAKARSLLDTSKSMDQTVEAENMITDTLRSLFAVAEQYPALKAQENYRSLMKSLEDTENRIANYREVYNRSVQYYNNSVQTFPSLSVASLFGFKDESFYRVEIPDIN